MQPANTPEGVLVRLKNKLCIALNIDIYMLKVLIDRFVNSVFANNPKSKTHFAKTNIQNELTKPKISIKVFFKFLRIINAKKVKIEVTVTTMRDRVVTVSEEINFSENPHDPEEDN
jgi:hypothetical protein